MLSSENKYDDIINISRPISDKYPRMSSYERAAQFAPFSALSGYKESIDETARFTDDEIELDYDIILLLNEKLNIIKENIDFNNEIKITYFLPDDKKEGGKYINFSGVVKKIDEYNHNLIMKNGETISINKIIDIDGDMFKEMYL